MSVVFFSFLISPRRYMVEETITLFEQMILQEQHISE